MQIIPFDRSYWVLPNKLMAGEIPADSNPAKAKGKLDALIKLNVKLVLNLMEEDETNHQGQLFHDYSPYLNQHKIETKRISIKDLSIPDKNTMNNILNLIDDYISQNKLVYVHCWGGVGRTGTVVGCFLKRHGFADNNNVFEIIEYLKRTTPIAHRNSPETTQQKDFVLKWA
jgi:protein-tyrosine phosphatase